MIRIIFFVLIATTAWCQTPQEASSTSSTILNMNIPDGYKPLYRRRLKKPAEKFVLGGFTTGIWIPNGRNKILGPHPSLGVVLGKWSDQFLWEFEMECRFQQSANNYKVVYQDSLRTTRSFFGGFIGLHFGYGIINFKRTSIYLMGGFGYDGFDAVNGNDTDQNPGLSINSFNLNSGLGIQHFGKAGGYWSLEALYNNEWYKNPGGTPLQGDSLTIRFSIGGISGL
jgi:hypothetical protein